MGTEKRERQKAGRQSRLEQARKQQQRSSRTRRIIGIGLLVVLVALVVGLISLISGGDEAAEPDEQEDTVTTTTVALDATPCPPTDGSAERRVEFDQAPPICIDTAKSYSATVDTSLGTFTALLDPIRAPLTVNNFVVLSRYKYYDGTQIHRVSPDFVLQGGDPQEAPDGTGGPGYQFDDELPEPGDYQQYSLAMANSGPNTNGSQFFVVLSDNGVNTLTSGGTSALYSLFGGVTEGFEAVDAIGAAEVAGETPVEPIFINSVTITES